MFIMVLVVYALLGIYEFVPLYKQKLWKDFFVNLGFAIISLTFVLLLSFDVPIPSPLCPVKNYLKFLFGK